MSRLTLIFLCLTFFVSGCATEKPHILRFYSLEYTPLPPLQKSQLPVILTIKEFTSSSEVDRLPLLYRDKAFARQEYTYHHWRAEPSLLIRDSLSRDLRSSGLFLAVNTGSSALIPTHRVEGILERCLEEDQQDEWQAYTELTITLVNLQALSVVDSVLFQRTYKERSPCPTKNPEGVAEAMSQNMRKLSTIIMTDIYQALDNLDNF